MKNNKIIATRTILVPIPENARDVEIKVTGYNQDGTVYEYNKTYDGADIEDMESEEPDLER